MIGLNGTKPTAIYPYNSSQLNLERLTFSPSSKLPTLKVLWLLLTSRQNFVEISSGKALILKVYAGCIYTKEFIGHGLCKDVAAYPLYRASYAVRVPPYRIL